MTTSAQAARRPRIALSQRVWINAHGERLDALDQRWPALLAQAGLDALAVPNLPAAASDWLGRFEVAGILLTGGNDLVQLGGDAPERDATEELLCGWAVERGLPLLGVCRGMQFLQARAGVSLEAVAGHVAARQRIEWETRQEEVNSYHRFGTRESGSGYLVTGRAADGVVKSIRHRERPWLGIMWHPERETPFQVRDLQLLRAHFLTPQPEHKDALSAR